MFIGRILSGNWEDGTLTVRDMPNEFALSARKVRISELDETLQLEALLVKWVEVGIAIKQCLELLDNGEKRITTGCVFRQLDAVLAEAKKLEVKP